MGNRIYKDEIDAAIRNGNLVLAGSLEKERNAKIDREGLGYEKSYTYIPFYEKDYGDSLKKGIREGASAASMQRDLDARNQKTLIDGYTQYAGDSINRQAEQYIALQNTLNAPFSYETGIDKVNAREQQLDDILNNIKNYKKFEYDPESDPLYEALSAQYTKNGQRAMQDTIAQMAARTGGMASSYAASAGNQAYANYMSELNGRIPELQQLAYQMYNDEYNKELQQAQIAQNLYDSALSRYQNDRNFAYGQYADNRNMSYNLLNDMISGERYSGETAYNREWQQRQWDYGVEQDDYAKKQDAQSQVSAWIAQGVPAEYIPKDIKEASGMTDNEINGAIAAIKKNTKTSSSAKGAKVSSAYADIVEYLWGETDASVVDDYLEMKVSAKEINKTEADEIRKVVLGSAAEYGTRFKSIKTEVREMKTRGYSKEKIVEYLDKQNETELTDAGYRQVLEVMFPDER